MRLFSRLSRTKARSGARDVRVSSAKISLLLLTLAALFRVDTKGKGAMMKAPGFLLLVLSLCVCALAEVPNTEFLLTIYSTAAVVRISITAHAQGVQAS